MELQPGIVSTPSPGLVFALLAVSERCPVFFCCFFQPASVGLQREVPYHKMGTYTQIPPLLTESAAVLQQQTSEKSLLCVQETSWERKVLHNNTKNPRVRCVRPAWRPSGRPSAETAQTKKAEKQGRRAAATQC